MNYTYTKILTSETIGDSLSSVNQNYFSLEKQTLNLKLTSDAMWTPMLNYYVQFGDTIKDAIKTINSVAPNIFSATTLVQNNSAGWVKPISVFYPTIFWIEISPKTILNTVSAWVQQNFPVIPDPSFVLNENTGAVETIISSKPTYVENQELIVYTHMYNIKDTISETRVLTDSTTCKTHSEIICATCRTCWYGGTYCGYNTWNDCGGNCSDCSQCKQLECFYAAPPYIPGARIGTATDYDSYATGKISAAVNINFQNVSESPVLNSFLFTVKDCNWIFQKSLAGPIPTI